MDPNWPLLVDKSKKQSKGNDTQRPNHIIRVGVTRNSQEGTAVSLCFLLFESEIFTKGLWYPSCSHCHFGYKHNQLQTNGYPVKRHNQGFQKNKNKKHSIKSIQQSAASWEWFHEASLLLGYSIFSIAKCAVIIPLLCSHSISSQYALILSLKSSVQYAYANRHGRW